MPSNHSHILAQVEILINFEGEDIEEGVYDVIMTFFFHGQKKY